MDFKLISDFKPAGDQGKAIKKLTDGYARHAFQTLLGVTGSGKTFTVANIIQNLQLPTLVLAHNKTLAAQLYSEFKNFFPENKVCYFVSYYDYYQPESYLPQTDTYIEKETMVNEKIEQLRLETAAALTTRKDVIVVSSVSCIYGFGSPLDFRKSIFTVAVGEKRTRKEFLAQLVELLYERNDIALAAGRFRVRGDVVDILQGFGGDVTRIEFFGDEIERIRTLNPITFDIISDVVSVPLFPAKPFMAPEDKRIRAITSIREELKNHLPTLDLIEAHRLEQRTKYDLEMMEELGYCKGIENYSRHFEGRTPGEPPYCLLDFFKHNPFSKEFLMIIDESHVSVPQIRGMYFGDYTRKKNLVDYGFRLPSALDNRPLKFQEFQTYMNHVIFTTATPAQYELETSGQVVEQVVRPTGLIDPHCFVRPIKGHIEDLTREIEATMKQENRILVTTLTKRSAEDLAEYLVQHDIKARYMHSEIDTLDRSAILKQFRLGVFDVLVGINLLREGLDLPEVGLVAILDADKEGFLRNTTSLIQTIGRAARNVQSRVILYADVMTGSLKGALLETERRRQVQLAYNEKHGITPLSIKKKIEEDLVPIVQEKAQKYETTSSLIELEEEMKLAVEKLDFERAITLRDVIKKIQKIK